MSTPLASIVLVAGSLTSAGGRREPPGPPTAETFPAFAAARGEARLTQRNHPTGRPAPERALGRSQPTGARSASAPRSRAGERFAVAPGVGRLVGTGPQRRFAVEVERGIPVTADALAAFVERVLGDRRGWGATGRASFRRVAAGPVSFRVVLALPYTTDRLCAPLPTNGFFSCFMRGRAVLNFHRWRHGAATYRGDRRRYRVYILNHEVGHALGYGHASCAARGRPAPVMAQQTKGVAPCTRNPWPRPLQQR